MAREVANVELNKIIRNIEVKFRNTSMKFARHFKRNTNILREQAGVVIPNQADRAHWNKTLI